MTCCIRSNKAKVFLGKIRFTVLFLCFFYWVVLPKILTIVVILKIRKIPRGCIILLADVTRA